MCPHLAFFSPYAPLSFVTLESFVGKDLGRLRYSLCPTDVFISDIFPPCHSAHPPQHPHLIYFWSCFLSFRCCVGICPKPMYWSPHSCVNVPSHFTDILLSHNTTLHEVQCLHSALNICVVSVPVPPVSSTLDPWYFKWWIMCSPPQGFEPAPFIGSPNLKSTTWVLGLLILPSSALLQVSKYYIVYVSSSPCHTMSCGNIIVPGSSKKRSWEEHVDVVKKSSSRMYCLSKLNSLPITPEILNVFYTSTIVSVWRYSLVCGGSKCVKRETSHR